MPSQDPSKRIRWRAAIVNGKSLFLRTPILYNISSANCCY